MKKKLRLPSLSAIEDRWQQEATRVAIEKARVAVRGGTVPPMTPVGRLSDTEWGWIVAAVLFGWIDSRARQAVDNGVGVNKYIRDTGIDPHITLESDSMILLYSHVRTGRWASVMPARLAASLGLSRMYDDDLEQLEAGMTLYDAFYRWCRDATGETHNWPTNKAKP